MRLTRVAVISWLSVTAAAGSVAYAEGDVARGKLTYQRSCVGCHGDSQVGPGPGPSLVGLVGRRAGTVAGKPYGMSLYESGIIWDEATLLRYLASPSDEVHGTIMPIAVSEPVELGNLVAYLKSLK